jgi:hypothetical protein
MKIFETAPKKQKRTCLTLEQKAQIQGYALKNPKKTQEDVKAWAEDTFQVTIDRTTVQNVLSQPPKAFMSANLQ